MTTGQQHPNNRYLKIWGVLFLPITLSYLVNYFHFQGEPALESDPDFHADKRRTGRRGLYTHGLGAVGARLCHLATTLVPGRTGRFDGGRGPSLLCHTFVVFPLAPRLLGSMSRLWVAAWHKINETTTDVGFRYFPKFSAVNVWRGCRFFRVATCCSKHTCFGLPYCPRRAVTAARLYSGSSSVIVPLLQSSWAGFTCRCAWYLWVLQLFSGFRVPLW